MPVNLLGKNLISSLLLESRFQPLLPRIIELFIIYRFNYCVY